jgi:hypothetical protein
MMMMRMRRRRRGRRRTLESLDHVIRRDKIRVKKR